MDVSVLECIAQFFTNLRSRWTFSDLRDIRLHRRRSCWFSFRCPSPRSTYLDPSVAGEHEIRPIYGREQTNANDRSQHMSNQSTKTNDDDNERDWRNVSSRSRSARRLLFRHVTFPMIDGSNLSLRSAYRSCSFCISRSTSRISSISRFWGAS